MFTSNRLGHAHATHAKRQLETSQSGKAEALTVQSWFRKACCELRKIMHLFNDIAISLVYGFCVLTSNLKQIISTTCQHI